MNVAVSSPVVNSGEQCSFRRIAVLGAGHGGCAVAADLARRGYEVRLHSRSRKRLEPLINQGGVHVRGQREAFVPLANITTEVAEAINGADLIMLVVPSIAHPYYAHVLAPLIIESTVIFLNPGHTGGGLHFVNALRKAGYDKMVSVCETVTLTHICRLEAPAVVAIYNTVRRLRSAAMPANKTPVLLSRLQVLYPNITPASDVLEIAFANINAVFHPAGMLMNASRIEGNRGNFLFYREGITESVGRIVRAVDNERLAVARALGVPTKSFLELFHEFGSTTDQALASNSIPRACRESLPNRAVKAPSQLDHRYLHEDVGYGLVPLAAFGDLVCVETPVMDSLIALASAANRIDYLREGLTLKKMGLGGMTPDEIHRFVREGRA